MAIRYFSTSLTNTTTGGIGILLANSDTVIIGAGVSIVATAGFAIAANTAANVNVQVDGTVVGGQSGVWMNNFTGNNTVRVGVNGSIISESNVAVVVDGDEGTVHNAGNITTFGADTTAVYFVSGAGFLYNTGTITSMGGVAPTIGFHGTDLDSTSAMVNSGSIIANPAFDGSIPPAFLGGLGIDLVTNTGYIYGNLFLNDGDDRFDGTGGRVEGGIAAGKGNDRLIGGLGADGLYGEEGNDVILFNYEDAYYGVISGGAGYDIGVNIDETGPMSIQLSNHGLEAYLGSNADEFIISGELSGFGAYIVAGGGNDLIVGSTVGDFLDGGSEVDVIYASFGDDTITGGNQGDWMQGGFGADKFVYEGYLESNTNGQDFVSDFSTAQGDKLDLSAITAGTATFNTGYGTGLSVYVFSAGAGASLVQLYQQSALQMQIVVGQAGLMAGDFIL